MDRDESKQMPMLVRVCCSDIQMSPEIRAILPSIFQEIRIFANVLPGSTRPASYPFSSFVINFNVATRGHRDGKDLKVCLVMPIGTFQGSELCLAEPGLVIPLQSGDAFIFPSCLITHLNLLYTGTHASLVCHTDREGERWSHDRNGWKGHPYFSDGSCNTPMS